MTVDSTGNGSGTEDNNFISSNISLLLMSVVLISHIFETILYNTNGTNNDSSFEVTVVTITDLGTESLDLVLCSYHFGDDAED